MFSPPKIRGTPITPMRLVAINQRNFRNANMVRQSVPRDSFQGRRGRRSTNQPPLRLARPRTPASSFSRPLPHRGVGAPYPLLSLFAYKVFTCHLAQRPGSSFNYGSPSRTYVKPRTHTHTHTHGFVIQPADPRGLLLAVIRVVIRSRDGRPRVIRSVVQIHRATNRFEPELEKVRSRRDSWT